MQEKPWPRCHGFATCCRCPDCLKREQDIAKHGFTDEGKIAYPKPKPQPWEEEKAA